MTQLPRHARFGVVLAIISLVVLGLPLSALADGASCGDTLVTDVTLEADMNCSGHALIVGADGITIDLNGHTITGQEGAGMGVRNDSFDEITVRNGTIRGFEYGVLLSGVHGSVVEDLIIEDNLWGVFIQVSARNRIQHNTIADNTVDGIALKDAHFIEITSNVITNSSFAAVEMFDGTSHSRIRGNEISSGGGGLYESGTRSNELIDNTIANTDENGIRLIDTRFGTISGNHVTNTKNGLLAINSDYNRIRANVFEVAAYEGVLLRTGSDGNHVVDNTVTGAELYGIRVLDSYDNAIQDNVVTANGVRGISVVGSSRNEVRANWVSENGHTGILIDNYSSETTVVGNTVEANVSYGIWVTWFSDSNTVEGNRVTGSWAGINVSNNSDLNTIDTNDVSDNTSRGIVIVSDSTGSAVTGNDVSFSGTGIQVFGAVDTHVLQNTASRNQFDGIIVNVGSVGTLVERNEAHWNGSTPGPWDGIDIDAPGTTVTMNRTNFNEQFGISAVEGTIDGGGNTARGNGQADQCLVVVCD